jgi:iron complex transport system substrate-binding protein
MIFKVIFFLLNLFILLSCRNEQEFIEKVENSIIDDLNNQIIVNEIPQRIISLAPNLTEMIFALNAGDKIIGNTWYCNFPAESKSVKKIGDMFSVEYEEIILLNADIIFMTVEGNSRDVYNKLVNLSQKVFVSNPRNFEGIKKTYSDLGKILGKVDIVYREIEKWNEEIKLIELEAYNRSPMTAFLIISINPLITAGRNTFMNEFFRICNLINIAEKSTVNYPILSREEVLKQNPSLIILPKGEIIKDDLTVSYPEWKKLEVIRYDRVIEVNPDIFFRPGPRFILALRDVFNKINNLH